MNGIEWYFDFISPFSYLQWHRLESMPEIKIEPKPILFAGLLEHWGHKGPAEIPAKRIFTYRHLTWIAERYGIPFAMPAFHPFNPLKALRLVIALGCSRPAIGEIYRAIWQDGDLPDDPKGWRNIAGRLGVKNADELIADPAVKSALLANGTQAIARGVFGVPTLIAGDELFWGFDATDMFLDYLDEPKMFLVPRMKSILELPASALR
jgi:2-hydroxychromene-2-carboxylate isomerase